MSPITLTERQHQLLCFVADYRRQNGLSPTFDEIGAELGLSKPTIHEHVGMLVKKGVLTRRRYESRSLSVTARGWTLVPPRKVGAEVWRRVAAGLRAQLVGLGVDVDDLEALYEREAS